MSLISPISVDLGAKYTGVYLTQYEEGEPLELAVKEGAIIVNSDSVTYSQAERTAKRHQVRGAKRRKMAKRLLWLWLEHCYDLPARSLNQQEKDALHSLLNRRGFTYLTEDVDEELLAQASSEELQKIFHPELPMVGTLMEAYIELTRDIDSVRQFVDHPAYQLDIKESIKRYCETVNLDKDDKSRVTKTIKALKGALDTYLKAQEQGHSHRKVYLQNIRHDLLEHTEFAFLRERLHLASIEQLANVLGHISNLPLKVLRRYFNDEAMKSQDLWKPEKLHTVFFRRLSEWRCESGSPEKIAQKALFERRGHSIVDIFENTCPSLTIPPFEDMNNRRPPLCQSLLIKPSALDKHLGNWKAYLPNLVRYYERQGIEISDGLDVSHLEASQGWAACLQRILELSDAHDPLRLRKWVSSNSTSNGIETAKEHFQRAVQPQHHNDFIRFATAFYQETGLARKALWFEHDKSLMKVCMNKPPHKGNQRLELVSGALGANLTSEQLVCLEKIWSSKERLGRRTLKGWCKLAAEKQKEYGVGFKHHYQRNQWLANTSGRKAEDKAIVELGLALPSVASRLGEALDIATERFANVFNLGKLFNLLEEDPKGFSKNCRCCTRENAWRGTIVTSPQTDNDAAQGLRLPADSTRPFDGMLARILDKQAYEIAKLKAAQLSSLPPEIEGCSIPLLIEENRFAFSASLAEVKKSNTKKKDQEKRLVDAESRWASKVERIKRASLGICPYTGDSLGVGGEIDHIVSRALSRDISQTVYNHEANLIYCSAKGNQLKGAKLYELGDLDPRYLERQFGTSDIKVIRETIASACQPMLERGELLSFIDMDEALQKALRHSLFVPQLRGRVSQLLHQSIKTRVNGTQAFFCKLIMRKLQAMIDIPLRFDVCFIDAQLAAVQRTLLADAFPEYAKTTPQPVVSHSIDAAMAMVAGMEQERVQDILKTGRLDGGAWLQRILPETYSVVRLSAKKTYNKKQVSGKALFKDGMFAEHFLSLIFHKGTLGFGFSSKNAVWLEDVEEAPAYWFEQLKPFLQTPHDSYEDIAQLSSHRYLAVPVNKVAAKEHLFYVAKNSANACDHVSADMLESLHYTTQKKNIRSVLYDSNKGIYSSKDAVQNTSSFQLTPKIVSSNIVSRFKKLSKVSGVVTLPVAGDWQRIANAPELADFFGKKKAFDEGSYQVVMARLFHQTTVNDRKHRSVRKEWSLPVKDSPAGGFRAKRRTFFGADVWQLFAAHASYMGFESGDDVNFNKPVYFNRLENSSHVSPLKGRFAGPREEGAMVSFDEWRFISVPDSWKDRITSVACCPNEKSPRFRFKVAMAWDVFRQMAPDDMVWDRPSDLPPSFKIKDHKRFKQLFGEVLGKPRSELVLSHIGETVTFEFTVEQTTKAMKEAYSASEDVVDACQ